MKLSERLEAKHVVDRPVKCWAISYGNPQEVPDGGR